MGRDDECGNSCEGPLWAGLILHSKHQGKPSYIISENTQGFVDYEEYLTAEEAEQAFSALRMELEPEDPDQE